MSQTKGRCKILNVLYHKTTTSKLIPARKLQNHRPSRLGTALAIALLVLTATFTVELAPARAQGSAKAATQEFVDQALQILRNKQKSVLQKRRELKPLMESHFDSTEMARSTLGYHWRSLTPDQRANFTRLFTDFIEAAYLDKVQDYEGQEIQFGQSRSLGAGYAEINTTIVQPGKNPIPVTYLLEQSGGAWKVYDVTVDNISIIENYRNQFNRVINQQGFPKLMADLRAKQQQLGSELGQG
jgi:phospholipid transport system substrate-binding protein